MTDGAQCALWCGKERIDLEIPPSSIVVEGRPFSPLSDPMDEVRKALNHPIGSRPLVELARDRKKACVVVSDHTRPVPNRLVLPPVLECLEQSGLGPRDTTILVATGMHGPTEGNQLRQMLGEDIVPRYRVINHDGLDRSAHRSVGRIQGVSIDIDVRYLEADLKILTGLIEPHAFAGFSGGGKSILPGLAAFEAMKFMHSYDLVANPQVRNGILEGNPFQEYVRWTAQKAGADFLVNALIDRDKALAKVVAGGLESAHDAGCQNAAEHFVFSLDRPADLVVVSGGGWPLDDSFLQALKGLVTAMDVSRAGASVLMAAGCGQGIGGRGFAEIIESIRDEDHFRSVHGRPEKFAMEQWAAQKFFQAKSHFQRILLFAPGLDQAQGAALGVDLVQDPQAELNRLLPDHPRVVVIPEGPFLAGRVTG